MHLAANPTCVNRFHLLLYPTKRPFTFFLYLCCPVPVLPLHVVSLSDRRLILGYIGKAGKAERRAKRIARLLPHAGRRNSLRRASNWRHCWSTSGSSSLTSMVLLANTMPYSRCRPKERGTGNPVPLPPGRRKQLSNIAAAYPSLEPVTATRGGSASRPAASSGSNRRDRRPRRTPACGPECR
jgi:hypothetical protein